MEPRPRSLAEVAARTLLGRSFEYELADFLHEFNLSGNGSTLRDAPALLAELSSAGSIHDAYLAAVAAALSSRIHVPAPNWTRRPERTLPQPWFASPGRHMRALLLLESPAAFRERNLFVSANALTVA